MLILVLKEIKDYFGVKNKLKISFWNLKTWTWLSKNIAKNKKSAVTWMSYRLLKKKINRVGFQDQACLGFWIPWQVYGSNIFF